MSASWHTSSAVGLASWALQMTSAMEMTADVNRRRPPHVP